MKPIAVGVSVFALSAFALAGCATFNQPTYDEAAQAADFRYRCEQFTNVYRLACLDQWRARTSGR